MISASFWNSLKMHICWGQTVQIVAPFSCCDYRTPVTLSNITLPHCHTTTLPHYYTATWSQGQTTTWSHCHTVTLPHCYAVTLSRCHTVTMWQFHTVTYGHLITQAHCQSFNQCNDSKKNVFFIHLRVLSSYTFMRRRRNINRLSSSHCYATRLILFQIGSFDACLA